MIGGETHQFACGFMLSSTDGLVRQLDEMNFVRVHACHARSLQFIGQVHLRTLV